MITSNKTKIEHDGDAWSEHELGSSDILHNLLRKQTQVTHVTQ